MSRAVRQTPVGVTVARKRREALLRHQEEVASRQGPPDDASINQTWEENSIDGKQTGNTSWRVFIEGSLIYLACVFLPSFVGFMIRLYSDYKVSQSIPAPEEPFEEVSWMEYGIGLVHFAREETRTYLCSSDDKYPSSWAELVGASWICSPKEDDSKRMFLWSPDAQWTDLGTVAFLSLALATIRIFILLAIIPLKEPNRLNAIIRCKSIHLLSRDYQLTPNGTPVITRKTATPRISASNLEALQMPDLSNPQQDPGGEDTSGLGLSLDESTSEDAPPPLPPPAAPPLPEPVEFLSELDEHSISINHRGEGFNSAPRLATASFRLVYSGLVAAVAFYYFSSYEFWPIIVGGTGKTAKCWDLSGGLSVGGVDGDFDAHNTALRLYYLHQSAYHWHSGAFHLLGVLLVVTRPRQKRLAWIRDSTSSYKRSFLQHAVAILLLSTTYVFSSLRRLGAIGMFAFDVSSFFLHLLQVCMNLPPNKLLRSAEWITVVYRFLVLPSFLYCRFLVWPILWWSALTESRKWLNQLDRILFPGASIILQSIWHTCMAGAMALNSVYLRRLLNHPHLSRIIRSRNLERASALDSN
uniref:TLC domain-containing protein n=1 Tax=Amphora coffeiformis TaxID=265554 RepID=A0A7S3KVC5_9STRA